MQSLPGVTVAVAAMTVAAMAVAVAVGSDTGGEGRDDSCGAIHTAFVPIVPSSVRAGFRFLPPAAVRRCWDMVTAVLKYAPNFTLMRRNSCPAINPLM